MRIMFKTILSLTVQPTWMPVKKLPFYVAEFTQMERKWVSWFDILITELLLDIDLDKS
jgi:meiotically up-regulated gene 157 (Mug157) protein